MFNKGFYIPDASEYPASFFFDIIYNDITSEDDLNERAKNDGVFIGRYILTRYDNGTENENYIEDFHEVVWQKVIDEQGMHYRKIALIGAEAARDAALACAQACEDSANDAEEAKMAAESAQDAALASAQACESSAEDALKAREEAETAATNADTRATNAEEAAKNAKDAADEAKRAAGVTADAATAAATSATNAANEVAGIKQALENAIANETIYLTTWLDLPLSSN